MKEIKIIETGNRFGYMNTGSFPKDYTREQKQKAFNENRKKVGDYYGFDWHKMFMADQKHEKGTYFEITKEYVEENKSGWTDIPEDILVITSKTPGVVIGHPVADCPVVMMTDEKQGISAIAHCSAELIDKKMPMMVADALTKAYNSKEENIKTYISACAGEGWTYNKYPNWAKDEKLWKAGIEADENGIFHINIRKVILKQLKERKLELENIMFNMDDTIKDPDYYSNSAASPYGLNQKEKAGRNFAGLFYKEKIKRK